MASRAEIEAVLGPSVCPRDLSLYHEALTHKSATAACGPNQERLEFLGDAVLSLCVTDVLFQRFPRESEGMYTRMRTRMVKGETLAQIGRAMRLERVLCIKKHAPLAPHDSDRLYEDTLEALVGAVYKDQGFQAALRFVAHTFDTHLPPQHLVQDTNYKDVLRKQTARHGMQMPAYACTHAEGVYSCAVRAGDVHLGAGEGLTKKKAEMEAARNALRAHFPDACLTEQLQA